uniref:Uncharacterized protein n=1 Tax=Crocodylus porosus TaxID=8502 RepID=A0A7M4EII6_CROPO
FQKFYFDTTWGSYLPPTWCNALARRGPGTAPNPRRATAADETSGPAAPYFLRAPGRSTHGTAPQPMGTSQARPACHWQAGFRVSARQPGTWTAA